MSDFETCYRTIRPYTVVSVDRCRWLWELSRRAAQLPGMIAELGCYRGGTAMLLKLANPNKIVLAFDTFTGIQNADPTIDDHKNGDFADAGQESVQRLTSAGVNVYAGYFPESADLDSPVEFCFAHFDGDTYQSCKDFLAYFRPRMVDGGIMVFDDWKWWRCPGVEKAVVACVAEFGGEVVQTAPQQAALVVGK